jgi:hypothetical protein
VAHRLGQLLRTEQPSAPHVARARVDGALRQRGVGDQAAGVDRRDPDDPARLRRGAASGGPPRGADRDRVDGDRTNPDCLFGVRPRLRC